MRRLSASPPPDPSRARTCDKFQGFFERADSFSLGVCNGRQMLATLHEIIFWDDHRPRFVRNRPEQFEARLVMVEVPDSPSILLQGMAGSRLPTAVAHGEGSAEFADVAATDAAGSLVVLRNIENDWAVAGRYPANPSGSPDGIAGLASRDGRINIVVPQPGTCLPDSAALLPPGRLRRGWPLDEAVPQCPGLGGMSGGALPSTCPPVLIAGQDRSGDHLA